MISYKIEAGTAQHIGSQPQQNDRAALFTGSRAPGYVLAVLAEGVAGGALASEQVLHTARTVFDQFKPGDRPSAERLATLLREIVHETHLIIKMNGVASGSTQLASFVAMVLTPHNQAVWAHVGDARLYRFEQGECQARTSDAAYIEHLIDAQQLPADAARNHRHSKMLLNLLGNAEHEPYVTIGSHEDAGAESAFLLCSGGLWHYFTDAELGAALSKNTPRQASEMLINKALERADGKGDNCTMAIIKLAAPEPEKPAYKAHKIGRVV